MSTLVILLAQRLWQAVSGLLTIILIAIFLTPETQGWYYSFLSITALYTLFDLGLSVVLVQLSARFSVGLNWLAHGELTGAHAVKFKSLVGQSARHYLFLAIVFAVLIIPGGALFFGRGVFSAASMSFWFAPWAVLALVTAAGITVIPFFSLIEGSGGVAEVFSIRLIQGILGSVACWMVLAAGGELWATAAVPGMGLAVAGVWLVIRRPVLLAVARQKVDRDLRWRRDVWPLQWRVGLSWLSGYFLTQIYTPVLFYYQGAVVAGQMGVSLTVANMLGLLAQSWITRHVSAMAQAASKREWSVLDRLFRRDLLFSTGFFLLGALVLCLGHHALRETEYRERMLAFWPFVGLLGVAFVNHFLFAFAAQLRSHQREPLVWVAVAGSVLTAPAALLAASSYSAGGVIMAILAVQVLLTLPASVWLWQKSNIFLRNGS